MKSFIDKEKTIRFSTRDYFPKALLEGTKCEGRSCTHETTEMHYIVYDSSIKHLLDNLTRLRVETIEEIIKDFSADYSEDEDIPYSSVIYVLKKHKENIQ